MAININQKRTAKQQRTPPRTAKRTPPSPCLSGTHGTHATIARAYVRAKINNLKNKNKFSHVRDILGVRGVRPASQAGCRRAQWCALRRAFTHYPCVLKKIKKEGLK